VVALGQAVAFLPLSIAERNRRPDLVHLPVSGVSPNVVAIAFPQHADSRTVRLLERAAREVAESPWADVTIANGAEEQTRARRRRSRAAAATSSACSPRLRFTWSRSQRR
jgi:hypothetical protein